MLICNWLKSQLPETLRLGKLKKSEKRCWHLRHRVVLCTSSLESNEPWKRYREKKRKRQSINLSYCYSKEELNGLNIRVWSWLRMNAGGVLNTFKSNGRRELAPLASGGRVSNAWATCLSQGNNASKGVLIPHETTGPHGQGVKDLSVIDGLASD